MLIKRRLKEEAGSGQIRAVGVETPAKAEDLQRRGAGGVDRQAGAIVTPAKDVFVPRFWIRTEVPAGPTQFSRVSPTGQVARLLGDGERGVIDGAGEAARLSFPFGLGRHPWTPRLHVNEEPDGEGVIPRRSSLRVIHL